MSCKHFVNYTWRRNFINSKRPYGFWKIENQRAFLGPNYCSEDVHKISKPDLIAKEPNNLIEKYSSTEERTNSFTNSEFNINPIESDAITKEKKEYTIVKLNYFVHQNDIFWSEMKNRKDFLNYLFISKKFDNARLENWNFVTIQDVIDHGGEQLVKKYKTMYTILTKTMKEISWKDFKLIPSHLPPSFWKIEDNLKNYFLHLTNTIYNISFYELTKEHLIEQRTEKLLQNKSLPQLIVSLFPELKVENFYWKSIVRQRIFMNQLQEYFKITKPEDWKNIRYSDFKKNGGSKFVHYYSSYDDLLHTIYPEVNWNDEINSTNTLEEQKNILHEISNKYQLLTPNDWNLFPIRKLNKKGRDVLKNYSSYFEMLTKLLPDYSWNPFLFSVKKLPKNFWYNKDNQQKFIFYVEQNLKIKNVADWNNVTDVELKKLGGGYLLKKYRTIPNLLKAVLPKEQLEDIKTKPKYPHNHWKNIENVKLFFDMLQEKLKLSSPNELLGVNINTISSFGGDRIFKVHSISYFNLLKLIYPNHNWDIFNTNYNFPKNFFDIKENQKNYLNYIGKHNFDIISLDDWYSISSIEFQEIKGAKNLLKRYDGFIDMLKNVYPDHNWEFSSKDRRLPPFYWDNIDNITSFIKKVEDFYNIKENDDWYRISISQIISLGGGGLLTKFSLFDVLSRVYPNVQWDKSKIIRKDKRAKQRWLCLLVKKLFPDNEVIEEYIIHEKESMRLIEIDIFVPKYQIGFEYQGEHHYKEIPAFGSMEMYKRRDIEKSNICLAKGITLVKVPYVWNEQLDSLEEYIDVAHPSLLFQIAKNLCLKE